MTKLIFLDIDGVLNNPACYRIASGSHTPADPRCVAALNHIVDQTAALIVVSSSWRIGTALCELRGVLKSWGVLGSVVGATPRLEGTGNYIPRWMEIAAWLEDHKGSRLEPAMFIIIDDDGRDASGTDFAEHLIHTAGSTGLTMDDANQAVSLLLGSKTGVQKPYSGVPGADTANKRVS